MTTIVTRVFEKTIQSTDTIDVAQNVTDAVAFGGETPDFMIGFATKCTATVNTAAEHGISMAIFAGDKDHGQGVPGTSYASEHNVGTTHVRGGTYNILAPPSDAFSYTIYHDDLDSVIHDGDVELIADGFSVTPRTAGTEDITLQVICVYGGDAGIKGADVGVMLVTGTGAGTTSIGDIRPNFLFAHTASKTTLADAQASPSMGMWAKHHGDTEVQFSTGWRSEDAQTTSDCTAITSDDNIIGCPDAGTSGGADGTVVSITGTEPGKVHWSCDSFEGSTTIWFLAVEFTNPKNVHLSRSQIAVSSTTWQSAAHRTTPVGAITFNVDSGAKGVNLYGTSAASYGAGATMYDGTNCFGWGISDEGQQSLTDTSSQRYNKWALVDHGGPNNDVWGAVSFSADKFDVATFDSAGTMPHQSHCIVCMFGSDDSPVRFGSTEIADIRYGTARAWLEEDFNI